MSEANTQPKPVEKPAPTAKPATARKVISQEVRDKAVKMVMEEKKKPVDVAKTLGIAATRVRSFVRAKKKA